MKKGKNGKHKGEIISSHQKHGYSNTLKYLQEAVACLRVFTSIHARTNNQNLISMKWERKIQRSVNVAVNTRHELLSVTGVTSITLVKTSTTAAPARIPHVSFTGTQLLCISLCCLDISQMYNRMLCLQLENI